MGCQQRCTAWVFLLLATAAWADNSQLGASPCCQKKALAVPIVAYIIDLGMPVMLLLLAFVFLRVKRCRPTCGTRSDVELAQQHLVAARQPAQMVPVPTVAAPAPQMFSLSRMAAWLAGLPTTIGRGQHHALHSYIETLGVQASIPIADLFSVHHSSATGLSSAEAAARLRATGPNKISPPNSPSVWHLLFSAVVQPFNFLMIAVAIVTVVPPNNDKRTFTLVMVLLVLAVLMRLIEEFKSARVAGIIQPETSARVTVCRDGILQLVNIQDVVPGEIVLLSQNDLVPGDVRIVEADHLKIGMSSLTGETLPAERTAALSSVTTPPLEHGNLIFMSSHVVAGRAKCLVIATGNETYVAGISRTLGSERLLTAFDYAIRRVVYVFIIFIVVLVPLTIALNGISTGDWAGALAFGLSVAVGLSPQAMPAIITANLAKGASMMRAQRSVIRRLDAVQNLGAMDVLCTDKTGTLTQDTVMLSHHLDFRGETCLETLRLAYANACFTAGSGNMLDLGIVSLSQEMGVASDVETSWIKVDEIPFDYQRRCQSVVLQSSTNHAAAQFLICKGALEELLEKCNHVQDGDMHVAMAEKHRSAITVMGLHYNSQGCRVLGLATRHLSKNQVLFTTSDELDLIFRGFLIFFDPPKPDAPATIELLASLGVSTKLVTGDSLLVAKRLCQDCGIPADHCLTGSQLQAAESDMLPLLIEKCTVFAKITPQQKYLIVETLQRQHHIVGFLGDGTNDALALRKADVGVSVNSGTDVAKEAADIVLLDKDLGKLSVGIRLGRITYGNTIKYIKFAASSSFGNTFSIVAAAAWLPFNPLAPIQILVLNLLYNISQFAIPWDSMDESFLQKPKQWSAKLLALYMLIVGPLSSVFDMTTFVIMWYYFHNDNSSDDAATHFETAWFLESLMTQTFIVHLLRTEKIPFLQSTAAWPLLVSSFGTMTAGIVICYIPGLQKLLSLVQIYPIYYLFLAATVMAYCVTVQLFKIAYIHVFNSWL